MNEYNRRQKLNEKPTDTLNDDSDSYGDIVHKQVKMWPISSFGLIHSYDNKNPIILYFCIYISCPQPTFLNRQRNAPIIATNTFSN